MKNNGGKVLKGIKQLERKTYVGRWLASSHKLRTSKFSNVFVIFFEVPKGVLEKMDYYRSHLLQGEDHKKN
jgi:hypothetical protein